MENNAVAALTTTTNQRLEDFGQKLEKSNEKDSAIQIAQKMLQTYKASPFTTEIKDKQPPSEFIQPKFPLYDGSSCPGEHVARFSQILALYSYPDYYYLKCKLFPASLKDGAIDWFYTLSPYSISNFDKLAETFTVRGMDGQTQRQRGPRS